MPRCELVSSAADVAHNPRIVVHHTCLVCCTVLRQLFGKFLHQSCLFPVGSPCQPNYGGRRLAATPPKDCLSATAVLFNRRTQVFHYEIQFPGQLHWWPLLCFLCSRHSQQTAQRSVLFVLTIPVLIVIVRLYVDGYTQVGVNLEGTLCLVDRSASVAVRPYASIIIVGGAEATLAIFRAGLRITAEVRVSGLMHCRLSHLRSQP